MLKYRNKWDRLNVWLTIITTAVLAFASTQIFQKVLLDNLGTYGLILQIIFGLVIISMIGSALFLCPISSELDGNTLKVNFVLRSKKIDLSGARVRTIRKVGMFEYWRKFGGAGFCGYWGYFGKEGETYLFYLTHSKKDLCLISSPNEKYKIMINAPHEWFDEAE